MGGVYPPSEDTYLILEVVKDLSGDVCIDVGTGSCILARRLAERCRHVIAIDVDIEACKSCPHDVDVVCGDGAAAFRRGDVLLSNLPYLPPEEPHYVDLYDLGLTQKVLRWISAFRPRVFVLTSSSLGRIDLILEATRAICRAARVAKLHLFFEDIYVVVALC
ncbi:MAG: protein-(glutamine-N5) methyltransferase [Pyrobaculum sp.]